MNSLIQNKRRPLLNTSAVWGHWHLIGVSKGFESKRFEVKKVSGEWSADKCLVWSDSDGWFTFALMDVRPENDKHRNLARVKASKSLTQRFLNKRIVIRWSALIVYRLRQLHYQTKFRKFILFETEWDSVGYPFKFSVWGSNFELSVWAFRLMPPNTH